MKAIVASILLFSAQDGAGQDSDFSPTLSDLVGEFNLLYGFHTWKTGDTYRFNFPAAPRFAVPGVRICPV